MRRNTIFSLSFILFLLITVIFTQSVSAYPYKKEVLGESTIASDVDVPPVTAGPGFFLPDSPFYFLDKSFQNLKLFFAFYPEKKAQIHEQVAQERMAELRVMLARNNKQGITRALAELTKENNALAEDLRMASATGKDVKILAANLNEALKRQREFLDNIADQSKGNLKLQLKTAKEELKAAKVEVENELPEEDLLREVESTILEDIEDDISEASESAEGLEKSIEVLTKLASEAAKKDQQKREEALLKAIENKNEALKRKEERIFNLENKKQERLLQIRNEAIETARETVKKAKETAQKFDEMKKAKEALNSEEIDDEESGKEKATD